MKNFQKLGLTISFCVASILPLAAAPDEHDRDDVRHHRYWDREHNDYHRWNRDEDRQWRIYLNAQHGPFVRWERAPDDRRQAYWHWRHEMMEHREHDRH